MLPCSLVHIILSQIPASRFLYIDFNSILLHRTFLSSGVFPCTSLFVQGHNVKRTDNVWSFSVRYDSIFDTRKHLILRHFHYTSIRAKDRISNGIRKRSPRRYRWLKNAQDIAGSNPVWDTGYPHWGLSRFYSAPPGKFRDSVLSRATTLPFHILSSWLFTHHPELPPWAVTDTVYIIPQTVNKGDIKASSSGYALYSYSGSTRFESRPRH
jgi:hypothetical protein